MRRLNKKHFSNTLKILLTVRSIEHNAPKSDSQRKNTDNQTDKSLSTVLSSQTWVLDHPICWDRGFSSVAKFGLRSRVSALEVGGHLTRNKNRGSYILGWQVIVVFEKMQCVIIGAGIWAIFVSNKSATNYRRQIEKSLLYFFARPAIIVSLQKRSPPQELVSIVIKNGYSIALEFFR